ncbi:thiol peroxidase [Candidatus Phytoplasma oryzae]|nr:thiol peroxidase [Candidatus Phytoplasma oryzae]
MVTFNNQKVKIEGLIKKTGDKAPNFKALKGDFSEFHLDECKDEYIFLNIVPSLDTNVCDLQTKKIFEEFAKYPNIKIITISNDLPTAQSRWCQQISLPQNSIVLSDYKELDFAKKYGVLISDFRLLLRSFFLLDKNRKIIYLEYASEITQPLDYDKIFNFIKNIQ